MTKKPAKAQAGKPAKSTPERRRMMLPVGRLLDPVVKPLIGRRGAELGRLIPAWDNVVGRELSRACAPVKITRGRKGSDGRQGPATLHLAVRGAFAARIQHRLPEILEKVNMWFGYGAIGDIRIAQSPLPTRKGRKRPGAAMPDEASQNTIRTCLAPVGDAALADALARLGHAIITKPRK